jgi:hypothetical protein
MLTFYLSVLDHCLIIQPFACAAVLAVALIWLTYLFIVQLFSGPKRDTSSSLPVPPRALTGNGAWPVLGHTLLFSKHGGDMAVLFPPEWREWRWLPWSRTLGESFSVFVWGQWRVVVRGPEAAQKVMEQAELQEGWAWLAPITLLGKSCLPFLDDQEAGCLRRMISEPLSQQSVVKQAPVFAVLAQKCVDDILAGHFHRSNDIEDTTGGGDNKFSKHEMDSASTSDGGGNEKGDGNSPAPSKGSNNNIKWEALRSYTFDLIDGPVLNLNKYANAVERNSSNGETPSGIEALRSIQFQDEHESDATDKEDEGPTKDAMMLWMQRLKEGLCGMKCTFGPKWTQVWRLNEYGRALNAVTHLNVYMGTHIEQREKLVPVHHEKGYSIRDPFYSTVPLIAYTNDLYKRWNDSVMGDTRKSSRRDSRVGGEKPNRARTRSEPEFPVIRDSKALTPDGALQEISAPLCPQRARSASEPDICGAEEVKDITSNPMTTTTKKNKHSILDQLLHQQDLDGRGMTRAATTETSILLWMMLDAGQAWTVMALNLLSTEEQACRLVQAEIDLLEKTYGKDRLFTSFVLAKMEGLDAMIYEAIRLCPEFLGGMKYTNQTVEFGGLQIPKNTNVIFCQPTNQKFDLDNGKEKRPEEMGLEYPSVALHGFLPLQGLEVPLMVLQTKVFLVVLLQNYSPSVSKKRTLMRKVHDALSKSFTMRQPDHSGAEEPESRVFPTKSNRSVETTLNDLDIEAGEEGTATARRHKEKTEMPERLFTRIPFPEPRRVIHIHARPDRGVASRRLDF